MDLSVQIDPTLVAQFISLLIFCVWSSINLMHFRRSKNLDVPRKLHRLHRRLTQYFLPYCNTTPAVLEPLSPHWRQIAEEPDWLQLLAFKHQTWQAAPLALKPLPACNPPTLHPFPSHLPPDVAGHIICNDSHPEPVPGEKAPEALRQRGARVYTPLKNRLVLWSLEQPHAPEPSLLIRGRPGKHMAGASALWWITTANPHRGHITNHSGLQRVRVCM